MFNVNDIIYYVVNNNVKYGRCVSVQTSGNTVVSYTVKNLHAPFDTTTVNAADARASGYAQVSVTPSSSPYPTKTPSPSLSQTMSVTPSPVVPTNLFPATTTDWTATNGTVTADVTKRSTTFHTATGGVPTFAKTFTVQENKYYNLSFNYGQGTARYAKLQISANGGIAFAVSLFGANSGENIIIDNLSDSGKLDLQLFVTNSTSITITYELYADSSLKTAPVAGLFYTLSDTNLTQVVMNVSLSASLSATPTPSPTLSVSTSNSQKVSPTPTPSSSNGVTPTPSVTNSSSAPSVSVTPSPTISASASPGASLTPSPTATVTGTPSAVTPSVTPTISVTRSVGAASPTPTATLTVTPSPTVTITPSVTQSHP